MKIFSIKDKYSNRIYSRKKKAELRRGNVNIKRKEVCFIYTTSPVKKITGYFIVERKIRLPIKELWDKTKNFSGVSKEEFFEYFKGKEMGTAILFRIVVRFKNEVSLDSLRKKSKGFRPPQSYCYVTMDVLGIIKSKTKEPKLERYIKEAPLITT